MRTLYVTTETAVEDHGTVLTFDATDEDGTIVRVGIDHRPAREILSIVEADGELAIAVEPWQIVER